MTKLGEKTSLIIKEQNASTTEQIQSHTKHTKHTQSFCTSA